MGSRSLTPGLLIIDSRERRLAQRNADSVWHFNFTVTVQDGAPNPETSSQHFTIQVTPPPPPTVVNSEPPTATVSAAYSFPFEANGGVAPLVWTETGPLPGGIGLSPGGLLAGTPSAAGKFPITLDVTDALSRSAPSIAITVRVSLARSGAFTSTGSLAVPRSGHSATLLTTGKVLIAGGANGAADSSAELYDPMRGSFAATGSMIQPRIAIAATQRSHFLRSRPGGNRSQIARRSVQPTV